jgi:hypothetical protein
MHRGRIRLTASLVAALSLSMALPANAQVYCLPDGTLFDTDYYAAKNPDVAGTFGDTDDLLILHYEMTGKDEGRLPHDPDDSEKELSSYAISEPSYLLPLSPSDTRTICRFSDGTFFDPVFYASIYPDVAKALGTDARTLADHYELAGKAEGRLASNPLDDPKVLLSLAAPTPVEPLTAINSFTGKAELQTSGDTSLSDAVTTALNNDIQAITKSGYKLGFVLVDTTTGQGVAYNPDGRFYSASTIKGPFVVSLAALNSGAISASRTDMYNAVHVSDNAAYSRIAHKYGMGYLSQWWADAGNGSFQADAGHARTAIYAFYSPRQLARLWLHNKEYFESGDTGAMVGSWFESPNASVIYSELHSTYLTRSKAGWIPHMKNVSATADGGIVYAGDHPYVVAIMTDIPSDFNRLKALMNDLEAAHREMSAHLQMGLYSIP